MSLRIMQLEAGISQVYRWFAKEAPGVTPREEGHLGMMWNELDELYAAEETAP